MIKIPREYKNLKENSSDSIAIMGLSVGKKMFGKKNVMKEYAQFLSSNFDRAFFVIFDLPKKYNIMAIDGVSEIEAMNRLLRAGDIMENFLIRICRDFSNLEVKRYSDFQSRKYYGNLLVLLKAYENNFEFRAECRSSVVDFLSLSNTKEKLNGWDICGAVDIAVRYRLEELAMLLAIPCLIEEEIVEIYPGLDVLHEKLQNREFDFCGDLNIDPSREFMEVYHED